ncbi:MAG: hypothetical protein H5U38_09585, partial [Calditrichaeota bacterium]|nr:hypothetical protein [Calditrichota bacterium]
FGQPHHLEDGLLTCGDGDQLLNKMLELGLGLVARGIEEHFHHERDHDLLPALPEQRNCAVKIKQSMANGAIQALGPDDFDRILSQSDE